MLLLTPIPGRSSAPGGAASCGLTRTAPGPRSPRTAASPGWPRCSWGRARARRTSCAPPPSSHLGSSSPPPTASMTGLLPCLLFYFHKITQYHPANHFFSRYRDTDWFVRVGDNFMASRDPSEQTFQVWDLPLNQKQQQDWSNLCFLSHHRSVSFSSTRSLFHWVAPAGTGGMTSRCSTSGPGGAGPSALTTMSRPPASHRRVSSWKGATTS